MKIGYARVSSVGQDYDTQIERLKQDGCKKIFSEKKSGTGKDTREALKAALEYARPGDILTVTKIDRLARNVADFHGILKGLTERGVEFVALDQKVDTGTPSGKLLLGVLALIAEFETDLRKERQTEGIARAKAAGVYEKANTRIDHARVIRLLGSGKKAGEVAEIMGISEPSVYRIKGKSGMKENGRIL